MQAVRRLSMTARATAEATRVRCVVFGKPTRTAIMSVRMAGPSPCSGGRHLPPGARRRDLRPCAGRLLSDPVNGKAALSPEVALGCERSVRGAMETP
jgi:hypothetical protein